MITQEQLKEMLHYDPETGIFTWKVDRIWKCKGKIAGGNNGKGHRAIGLFGKHYLAHRLAWFYVYGEWPRQIDHKNNIRHDNRIDNLRPAKPQENSRNSLPHKDGTSKYKGVSRGYKNKWQVSIMINKKSAYLGLFKYPEQAAAKYDWHAYHAFGEFAKLNGEVIIL